MKLIAFGLLLAGSLIVVAQQPLQQRPTPEDRLRTMQRQMTLLDRPIGTPASSPALPQASYTADSVRHEGGLVRLTGNVRIGMPTFVLYADSAEYRPATGEIEPHGNVKVRLIQPAMKKYKVMQ
jgi:lipopolysaccharide assembly outer membrane protein LptD (OstA)